MTPPLHRHLGSHQYLISSAGFSCPFQIYVTQSVASKGPSIKHLCTGPWALLLIQQYSYHSTFPGTVLLMAPGTTVWLASCLG